jgi:LysR family glycine cleavage system transcriptional activator
MLIVGDDLAAGRLMAPFSFRLPTGCGYYIVCLPAAADRPKVKAFREWVMAELNGSGRSREAAADERSGRS